jgi:hypothetical protein
LELNMKLHKVISGGQTGADQGGLIAAKEAGLETGGTAPLGFLTESGEKPSLAEDYGLVALTIGGGKGYAARTFANVKAADATLRFANDFGSPGERCTQKAITEYDKPSLDIAVDNDGWPLSETDLLPQDVAAWLVEHDVGVLNVAGSRESKCPSIEMIVKNFLAQMFTLAEDKDD